MTKQLYKEERKKIKDIFGNSFSKLLNFKKESSQNEDFLNFDDNNVSNEYEKNNEKKHPFIKKTTKRLELYKIIIFKLKFKINLLDILRTRIISLKAKMNKMGAIKKFIFQGEIKKELMFLQTIYSRMDNGESFNDSLDGFVTNYESMIIKSTDSSDIIYALETSSLLLNSVNNIKSKIKNSFFKPLMAFIILNVLMYVTAYHLAPVLDGLKPMDKWTGGSLILKYITFLMTDYLYHYIAAIISIILMFIFSFKIIGNPVRDFLDKYFVWKLYKEFSSGIFLISLNSLVKCRTQFITALSILKENSDKYSSMKIDDIIQRAKSGNYNSANSLVTEFNGDYGELISEIGGEAGFDLILDEISSLVVPTLEKKIDKLTSFFTILAMALSISVGLIIYYSFITTVIEASSGITAT